MKTKKIIKKTKKKKSNLPFIILFLIGLSIL
ncbi:class C sortase, partial [Streptococcus agalactiae]|nr:class C sortase [Streptococcus agalactiae]